MRSFLKDKIQILPSFISPCSWLRISAWDNQARWNQIRLVITYRVGLCWISSWSRAANLSDLNLSNSSEIKAQQVSFGFELLNMAKIYFRSKCFKPTVSLTLWPFNFSFFRERNQGFIRHIICVFWYVIFQWTQAWWGIQWPLYERTD